MTSHRDARAWAGTFLLLGCTAAALLRALTVQAPPPPNRLSPAGRRDVGRAAALLELKWRKDSIHHFPDDCWSQDDDFHAAEESWIKDEAGRRRVPVTDIFQSIDEDLRTFPVSPPRKAGACPCKPRPFYD